MLLGTSAGLAKSVLPAWAPRQKAAISLDRRTGNDCPWTSHCKAWITERLKGSECAIEGEHGDS